MDNGGFGSEPSGVLGLGSGFLGGTLRLVVPTEDVALQFGDLLLEVLNFMFQPFAVRAPS